MALDEQEVVRFIAEQKVVPDSEHVSWRRRGASGVYCRLGVFAGKVTVGELVLVVNLADRRNWTFKLLRRGDEVLRWDLAAPPFRHSNPPGRPPGFPGKVRDLEHEHRWVAGLGMTCAVGLRGHELAAGDHRQALAAFCGRANIAFNARYEAPPPPGEQLQFGG